MTEMTKREAALYYALAHARLDAAAYAFAEASSVFIELAAGEPVFDYLSTPGKHVDCPLENVGDVTWCTTHGVYILTAKTPVPKLAMDHLHFDRQ